MDKCSKSAYKARKRAKNLKQSNAETTRIKQLPIEQLKAKEFLSISELCQLVGNSRCTIYRLIEQGDLKKIKVGSHTIIKRAALNKLLSNKEPEKPEISNQQMKDLKDWKQKRVFNMNDCYTLTEIQDKYGVSESTVRQLIKRNSIPKMKKSWCACVPKQIIDELLT